MKRKQYAVIGLGNFGSELSQALLDNGNDVLGVDVKESVVSRNHSVATQVIQFDATDEYALRQSGITNVDHVILAMGESIEDSLVVSMILSELKIKFSVKATNSRHQKLLSRMGVLDILEPEKEMIRQYAHKWSQVGMPL
ncbi:NAD-binding protein [Exiguobacterium sp. MER 193]|uniref:potassium channel family protein n=1 Tax=Exiguobacterium sp. MER 193 TaxID=2939564 RepID=UPI00203A5F67|nr:NAD-binding protein [Exiguobacterium sp. MER 193]